MSASKVDNEPAPGVYEPRRSQHVSTNLTPSDGDIWEEKLSVCEGASPTGEPRLLIRSFYRNSRTKERVWDEPPSGAGTVVHATSEMRKTAEMQKEELQLTLEMIPPEEEEDVDGSDNDKIKKGKKGFFGRFRKKKEQKQVQTSKDLNLQRAIARSMADQGRGGFDEPIVYYDGGSNERVGAADDEDEDMALAKALSMSESAAQVGSDGTLTEEEMFQRALEESQKDSRQSAASGVASMPTPLDDSFSSFTTSPQMRVTGTLDPNNSDRKLPAIPFKESSAAPPLMKFDPIGK